MVNVNRSSLKLLMIALMLAMPSAFCIRTWGQEAPAAASSAQTNGAPDDWSFHHLVFSNPGTREDAVKDGRLDQWLKITADRRYQMQLKWRSGARRAVAAVEDAAAGAKKTKTELKKDWSTTLSGAVASLTSTLGTLSSSSISGSSTLTADGVTFDASAPTAATQTGTFTSAPTNGQTVTITNGTSNTLTLTVAAGTPSAGTITFSGNPSPGDTVTIGGTVYTWESTASAAYQIAINTNFGSTGRDDNAKNLEAAINGLSSECTGGSGCITSSTQANTSATATVSGAVTTVTNTTTGSINFAESSSTTTASPSTGTLAGPTGANSCTSASAGTFINDSSTATLATNLAAAIIACNTTYPAVGVSAASSGAQVTVTSDTPGSTGGGNLALAEGLTGFTWAGTGVSGGTDGTTSGTSSPPTFAYWSGNAYLTTTQVAANIASAINANPTLQVLSTGVSATSSGAAVTIAANAAGTGGNSYAVSENGFSAWPTTGDLKNGGPGTVAARVQPNAYPAKFSFGTTSASCSDFVVYPTGATGAATAANIIAYDNLYVTGCSGANPSAFWAYNTGGAVSTSPVLSFDGTQVAYVQVSGSTASLVVLRWAANPSASVGTPQTLTAQTSGTAYHSCSAPCYYAVSLGANDTFSAPFYDYNNDAAYVGDDSGKLHKITGVFNGTPALDPSGFPVNLGSNKLSSPVFDPNWAAGGQVFVGDFGGVLHCVNGSTGAVIGTSGSIGTAIADAPLINSSANYVLAFVTNTSNTVYGYGEQFFPTSPGIVGLGTGGTGYYLYSGTFDNAYYESSNATGNIYVLGNTGVTTGETLYRVGLTGGFLNGSVTSAVTGLTASGSNAYPWPSPVIEFCNNGANECALQTASGCTLNSSTTITCTGGGFTSGDVGASVIGTDIPSGATISTVSSATKIIISAAASGNASGVSLAIGATSSGTDYMFFSVNRGTPSGCTSSAGNGCILAYNVSYPGAVSEAGSGLNVTTPTTDGCWATGGLIVDNSTTSATLAGASQLYFVNLDANAAGSLSGVTSSGCTSPSTISILDGVQAAQSSP